MTPTRRSHSLKNLILSSLCWIIAAAIAQAAPILEVRVADVTCWNGQQNVEIPIYVKNVIDSIAAFDLWFMLDRPDIATFRVDSGIVAGCLISPWGDYYRQSLTGQGYDLRTLGGRNFSEPYILPQDGSIPFFKMLVNTYTIPDSMTGRTAEIAIQWHVTGNFCLTDPRGDCIGVQTELIPDTSWFACLVWNGTLDSICLLWEQVPGPPADSIAIDTVLISYVDTTQTRIINGSLTVRPCGDASSDARVNVLDVTFIISYLYQGGPAPVPVESGDMNFNQTTNVLDITYLINALYRGGPKPVCQ